MAKSKLSEELDPVFRRILIGYGVRDYQHLDELGIPSLSLAEAARQCISIVKDALAAQPKQTRQNKWLEDRVAFLDREIASRNDRIAHLMEVVDELHGKRMDAVHRSQKLQLENNRLKRNKS